MYFSLGIYDIVDYIFNTFKCYSRIYNDSNVHNNIIAHQKHVDIGRTYGKHDAHKELHIGRL